MKKMKIVVILSRVALSSMSDEVTFYNCKTGHVETTTIDYFCDANCANTMQCINCGACNGCHGNMLGKEVGILAYDPNDHSLGFSLFPCKICGMDLNDEEIKSRIKKHYNDNNGDNKFKYYLCSDGDTELILKSN